MSTAAESGMRITDDGSDREGLPPHTAVLERR